MTEAPIHPLVDPPEPPAPEPTATELVDNYLAQAVTAFLMHQRVENPGLSANDATLRLLAVVCGAAEDQAPVEAIRASLLTLFEACHPRAMNFNDIRLAKEALEAIAGTRRKQELSVAKLVTVGGEVLIGGEG